MEAFEPLVALVATIIFLPLMLRGLWDLLLEILPFLILVAVLGACGGFVYIVHKYGESIARFYYFTFHPHPAAPIVRRALNTGAVLDGPALASALGALPPGNSVFRKVRVEQAEMLVARMQTMSRATVRDYECAAAEGYERAAVHTTNEAIALAAVALEKAKAAWQSAEAIKRGGRA